MMNAQRLLVLTISLVCGQGACCAQSVVSPIPVQVGSVAKPVGGATNQPVKVKCVADLLPLVEKILRDEPVFSAFRDPVCSRFTVAKIPEGVMYAYLLEYFSMNDNVLELNYERVEVVGDEHFTCEGILVGTDDVPVTKKQLPLIRDIYKKWLMENIDIPIAEFRENRKKKGSCLIGKGFEWK
jgi:hypothetical protein